MSFPFFGQQFTFRQPDGQEIRVRGTGDQHRAVFETLDGFTVLRNPVTGFYEFAQASADEGGLATTGLRVGAANPRGLGIAPGARPSSAALRAQAQLSSGLPQPRWEQRRLAAKSRLRWASEATGGVMLAPPSRGTVGDFIGLCLLVQFPDVPATLSQPEVANFCNAHGYSGFGNAGSAYDYFFDNSLGKLRYTNVVAPYYTAAHPRAYYTNEAVPYGQRARELIVEALRYHLAQGMDFSMLTADDQDYVFATNVYYAGTRVNGWAKGLWPHASRLVTGLPLATGKVAYDYQITDMTDQLTLGTFCHENGHMICDFPDLYDYGYESAGVGVYCLMCGGANADPRNPTHVNAYLKYRAGWAGSVVPIVAGLNATARANANEFFLFARNATEYFILENRQQSGRDRALTDSGLAIWHVDELGDNSNEQMTAGQHYECSLEQADGNCDLERNWNRGDANDLFHAGYNDTFADGTSPRSRWWNGAASGLSVRDVSASGATMTFRAG